MQTIVKMITMLCLTCTLAAEEEKFSVGPLPPIGLSLDAPVQIDEENTNFQEQFIATSSERLEGLLATKRFPFEALLIILLLSIAYFAIKLFRQAPAEVAPPPLTPEERLAMAQKILEEADDELSDAEAISLFHLLDPLVESLPDPEHYLETSERVKFAGVPLRKIDLRIN